MYTRIESLCEKRGITITQMCRDAQIPRGNLSDLKYGRTKELSTKSLAKISAYFGCDLNYLLTGETTSPVENIRAACKERGTTIAQLERKLGYGNGLIAGWAKAKGSPPYERVLAIAQELNVSVDDLMGTKKESPAAQMSSGVDKEILDIVRSLDADQKETALAVLQALVRKKGK